MKKLILLISLIFSILMFSQQSTNSENNPFQETATETTTSNATGSAGGEQQEAPGNPGEPVPINSYPFVLLSVAIVIMVSVSIRNSKKSIKI